MEKLTFDEVEKSYDELPYVSKPFHSMHPERLASVAIVAGLDPVPVDRARVLEIGCAGGGNLIPVAEALPQSTFVGIDLSTRQINEGQAIIDQLGMTNIRLRAMNLMEIGPEFGQFDYIVCHGVYSWVPPDVAAKILDICRENLSPNGLACVSYNTYPGWHQRMMAREMMLYHIDRSATALEQVRQARELFHLMNDMIAAAGMPMGSHEISLRDEQMVLDETGDHYIFHEHLETFNEPVYFHEFARRVAARGLQYVNRAVPDIKAARLLEAFNQSPLGNSGDPIRREQYLDFLAGNCFRQSVLCHSGLTVNHDGDVDSLRRLAIMGMVKLKAPGTPTDLTSNAPVTFIAPNNTEITVGDLVVKAALTILVESAQNAMPFDELAREVQHRARRSAEPMPLQDLRRLGRSLLQCYQAGVVQLIAHLVPWLTTVSDKPQVTPFARMQAANGESSVTNRRHLPIEFPPFELSVLALLDGTRDRAAIEAAMAASPQVPPIPDAIPMMVDKALLRIARSALLIG